MKVSKIICLLALILVAGDYCSAQAKANKTVQKLYSKNTTEALAKRQTRSIKPATVNPAEQNTKTLQQVRVSAKQKNRTQVYHPNNNLTTEQKKKLVDANIEKLRHNSGQYNLKKPTAGTSL
jgi:uncharacterized protein YdaU (DUF1376 family)